MKIPHLFQTDKTTGKYEKIPTDPTFGVVSMWSLSEKLPGLQLVVSWSGKGGNAKYEFSDGKGLKAEDAALVELLNSKFDRAIMRKIFEQQAIDLHCVVLGGEFGSEEYSKEPKIVLLDAHDPGTPNSWLEVEDCCLLQTALKLDPLPHLLEVTPSGVLQHGVAMNKAIAKCREGFDSLFGLERGAKVPALGIVARSSPNLYTNEGKRMMWQLDCNRFSSVVEAAPKIILPGRF